MVPHPPDATPDPVPTASEVDQALEWLIRVHDADVSARRLAIVRHELERLRAAAAGGQA